MSTPPPQLKWVNWFLPRLLKAALDSNPKLESEMSLRPNKIDTYLRIPRKESAWPRWRHAAHAPRSSGRHYWQQLVHLGSITKNDGFSGGFANPRMGFPPYCDDHIPGRYFAALHIHTAVQSEGSCPPTAPRQVNITSMPSVIVLFGVRKPKNFVRNFSSENFFEVTFGT